MKKLGGTGLKIKGSSKEKMTTILNGIRAGASAEYQSAVPIADFDNINSVGNPIMSNPNFMNEFINSIMNRIALVLIKNKRWESPLARFKKGLLPFGSTVEEIFIDLAQSYQFQSFPDDDNLADVFKRHQPNVKALFHQINRTRVWPISIQEVELRRAFLSYEGLEQMIAGIIESLYTSNTYEEFEVMKSMLASAIANNKLYNVLVPNPVDEPSAKAVVKALRAWIENATFISRDYNAYGVANHSPKDQQVILIDPFVEAEISVEVLAAAFNLSQADYTARRVVIDNFYTDTETIALIVDENWFMIWDVLFEMRNIINPKHLYINYFLHHHQIMSYSDFEVAIRLTSDENAVNPLVTGINIVVGGQS